MPDLNYVRTEIERMRVQVSRQRKEILQLLRSGISTASAELLFVRMHAKIDQLRSERERLKAEQPSKPKILGGRSW
jgi:Fe2+ or Zn2+ uptake regulation protein